MKDHIEKFIRYMETERAVCPTPLRAYRKDLESFSGFIKEGAEDVEPVAIGVMLPQW